MEQHEKWMFTLNEQKVQLRNAETNHTTIDSRDSNSCAWVRVWYKDVCKVTRTSSWGIIYGIHFWIFFIDIIFSSALWLCSRLSLLTKVSTSHIYWVVRWPVFSAYNLTTFMNRLSRTFRILKPLQPHGPVEACIARSLYDDVCSLECIVSSDEVISK
jgi:hypothetical protein